MIVVCGESLFDLFVESDRGAGFSLEARPGGSPFNVAIGLARLGQPVAFLGGISQDFMGARLMRVLDAEGVETQFIQRPPLPTTLSVVGAGADGLPAYAFYGDGADRALALAEIPPLGRDVRAIHFGSFSTVVEPAASAIEALLRRESPLRLISYDPNIRTTIVSDLDVWRRKLLELLPFVHLLKISTEDFFLLFPGRDPESVAREWMASGVRLVVLTRGAAGASAWTAAHGIDLPAITVPVVDTVGAGDSFQAAILAALAEMGRLEPDALAAIGIDGLRDLLAFAANAAAITCSRRGADMPLRTQLPPLTRRTGRAAKTGDSSAS